MSKEIEINIDELINPLPDINTQFCRLLTKYPSPFPISGNNGFKLYYLHNAINNNLIACGYKFTIENNLKKHYLICFSDWNYVLMLFPGILNKIPYEYNGEKGEFRIVDCKNTKVGLPQSVPFKLIIQSLKKPNFINWFDEIISYNIPPETSNLPTFINNLIPKGIPSIDSEVINNNFINPNIGNSLPKGNQSVENEIITPIKKNKWLLIGLIGLFGILAFTKK